MKQYLLLIFCLTAFLNLGAQDYKKKPIISKVTATWCPNCGSWGWDYMEALKDEFNNGDAILLGVHHSGDLENPVSDWFAKNLKNSYQPQFFVNNGQISVGSNNWPGKVDEIRDMVDMVSGMDAASAFNFDVAYVDNDNTIQSSVNIAPLNKSEGDYYFAVYIYENNVVNFQSQQGSNAMHPFVLRDVISENYWGDSFTMGTSSMDFSFDLSNTNWNKDNVGLLAIMWEKEGNDYIVDNSISINNIGLLSSTKNILDANDFRIITENDVIEIITGQSDTYNVALFSTQGQMLQKTELNGRVQMNAQDLPTGLYVVLIENEKGQLSQRIFVK
ncbi:MAG: T9SS type A sorting domain-containing protein [Saprospiraceae bacterium]|nr:T9SS type A sorting domain-containing protein [Saprospiraceae bacterium]